MAEVLTYTTPQQPVPTATDVEVIGLEMYIRPTSLIRIIMQDNDAAGRIFEARYTEAEGALALILSLNKANLTIKSLNKRIIEKLLADGKLAAGTITGSPD